MVLKQKLIRLKTNLNDLDQYRRRNSIRLNNVHLPDDAECEPVVLEILNKALPQGQSSSNIKRYHPVGKPNRKKNRQIIMKFHSYKIKAKTYESRFNLSNIYMSEDLTSNNQSIVSALVKSKKAKTVAKFWTIDGKIFAKAHMLQLKVRIHSVNDIDVMIADAKAKGYIADGAGRDNDQDQPGSQRDLFDQ